MAEFKYVCVFMYVSSETFCTASENPITVSIMIGVEDTDIQLAVILMKLKWTQTINRALNMCASECAHVSVQEHKHACFAHVEVYVFAWLHAQGLLSVPLFVYIICECLQRFVYMR